MSRRGKTIRELERRDPGLVMLALVWRHLLRHRLRSVLTLLGVALGVAVAVAVQLANGTALEAFAATARAVAGPATWQIIAPGGEVNESMLPTLRPLADLATFGPVVEAPALVDGRDGVAFRLIGTDLLAPTAFRGYASEAPQGAVAGWPTGMFITTEAARVLRVRVGDPIPLILNDRRVSVPVAGLLPVTQDTASLDAWVAFIDIAAAQELLGRTGKLDRIDVMPREGVDDTAVRNGLQAILKPGLDIVEPRAATQTAERMLASFRLNLMALSFVALIVGAFLVYNAVSISVVQRRREVAILRSMGALKWQIFGIFAMEASIVGSLGGLLGMALGAVLALGAVGAVGRTVDALYVDTPVVGVAWEAWPFIVGFAAGLGLALIASLVPAIEASTTEPALAMRAGSWEGKQRGRTWPWTLGGVALLLAAVGAALIPANGGMPWGGYAAAALIVLGCSLWAPAAVVLVATVASKLASVAGLPVPILLGARNFRHAVGRNAVAVAALMVGAAMTIGVATMVTSFRSTVATWIDTTLPGAFYISSPTSGATGGLGAIATVDPRIVKQVAKVPGVVAVEGFRERILPYNGIAIHLGATDMAVLKTYGQLSLRDPGDAKALYAACIGKDKVLVSEALTIKHNVDRGGMVTLPTPAGSKAFLIEGVYHDYASDQGYVLMDKGTYMKYWHDPEITSVAVYADPKADLEVLRQGLRKALGASPVAITGSRELRARVLQVFDDTFAVTYALHTVAITVSLLGVVSTLVALVLERGREIAILRQLGLLRRQLTTMMVVEAGLIGATGALLGLVAGGMLAAVLIQVINRESFGWTVYLEPPFQFAYLMIAAVIGAAMLAGWLPARHAAAGSIAEGLRDE